MNAPRDNTLAWSQKAEEDLLGIRHLMAGVPVPWSLVCFHAQQAAEKYLKAFLVSHGFDPERTHDLAALIHACERFDSSLGALRDDCSALTDYAVDARYPDVPFEATEQLGREAVAMAERICNAIRHRLPKP